MTGKLFHCARCKGIFTNPLNEDEMNKNVKSTFGFIPEEQESLLLCEDCYEIVAKKILKKEKRLWTPGTI